MKNPLTIFPRLIVVCAALMLPLAVSGCFWNSARQNSAPHVMASLADRQYFWFLHRGDSAKDLTVWRVNAGRRTFEQFKAPKGKETSFRMWQIDGSWIWYLTSDGLWRIRRFPPGTGDAERYEPKIINKNATGELNVMLVQNARIVIGAEQGLYIFDRQTQELIKVGSQRPDRIRDTPFGIIVLSGKTAQVLDATPSDPALKDIAVNEVAQWQDIPPQAYIMADPARSAVVAVTDPQTMLLFNVKEAVKLRAGERIVEAGSYRGRLFMLTSEPRLIELDPTTNNTTEYCIYHVAGAQSHFEVQDGRLRCGSIVVEQHGDSLAAGAMRLYPGDIKPLPPVPSGAVLVDIDFGRKAPGPRPEEAPREAEEPTPPREREPVLVEPEAPAPGPMPEAPPTPEASPAPESPPAPETPPEPAPRPDSTWFAPEEAE